MNSKVDKNREYLLNHNKYLKDQKLYIEKNQKKNYK